ncbi:hypothetical protein CWC18_01630 [Pseudoalteromonas aurantia]|uniref:Uncharacterized protein n=2 Tax=Pseudoalteromonas aurantia TaxID=43654 RepID=A0ABY2VZM5_9GAMM|nr:hypothetical protein CWC18_01630 [Pseudoalteromonas aurantia]TMO75905.1 hypothetical protein CWC20_06510 [Pseudoalteromonas aurantia]
MRANKHSMAKNKLLLLITFCFIISSQSLNAIELSVVKEEHQLSLKITDIRYPSELLSTEINSGLQSRFYSIISFKKGDEVYRRCSYSLNVTYDLWDEHYRIEKVDDYGLISLWNITDVQEVYSLLKNQEIKCPLSTMQAKNNIRITAQVFVNPVEHKRIEKIKSWINSSQGHKAKSESNVIHASENRSYSRIININGKAVKSIMKGKNTTVRPRFEKLFDKILSQYSGPSDIVSLWKSEIITKTIKRQQVNNEK